MSAVSSYLVISSRLLSVHLSLGRPLLLSLGRPHILSQSIKVKLIIKDTLDPITRSLVYNN